MFTAGEWKSRGRRVRGGHWSRRRGPNAIGGQVTYLSGSHTRAGLRRESFRRVENLLDTEYKTSARSPRNPGPRGPRCDDPFLTPACPCGCTRAPLQLVIVRGTLGLPRVAKERMLAGEVRNCVSPPTAVHAPCSLPAPKWRPGGARRLRPSRVPDVDHGRTSGGVGSVLAPPTRGWLTLSGVGSPRAGLRSAARHGEAFARRLAQHRLIAPRLRVLAVSPLRRGKICQELAGPRSRRGGGQGPMPHGARKCRRKQAPRPWSGVAERAARPRAALGIVSPQATIPSQLSYRNTRSKPEMPASTALGA